MKRLLDSDPDGDIEDPCCTGDFDVTYDDIVKGCTALLAHLCREMIEMLKNMAMEKRQQILKPAVFF